MGRNDGARLTVCRAWGLGSRLPPSLQHNTFWIFPLSFVLFQYEIGTFIVSIDGVDILLIIF